MALRPETEAKWRNLVDSLPEWTSRVRHPAQFWPQFRALVREIEMECGPGETAELSDRVTELVKDIQPLSEGFCANFRDTERIALKPGVLSVKMTPRQILESANAEMAAGNPEGFLAFCSDDIRWEMVGGAVLVGRSAVLEWAKNTYALAPPQFTSDLWIVEGDWLAVHGEITVQDSERGPVQSRYCDLWRIQEGKLTELRAFSIEMD